MPQITVDHSAQLTDVFDRRGFGLALNPLVVEVAAAKIENCKIAFRPADETVVGDTADGHAVVHVTIGLLAGRSEETKARLTEGVLDLIRQFLKPAEGLALHVSAEVRDLDDSYRKYEEG
ncbi:5-carboxymethyl-2-hydroxymuconate Delta-isomerase [Streptomyces himalayensis]|uniref:Isomerase n=2 Tax=Streptomyces himalayensis TaxID=2820085 RepID=A0A7W2HDW9_9ACTN|nr:isomerase [Streptomyces himalayensis]MBA2948487.1 isomerase [Streptomyces himalayensis subsp. himalayensis]MBA4860252.1 isomerase [Streptomyces himalayensis subsp. aureolus]